MKKRLLIAVNRISGGGAERQAQYLLKNIDRNKFDISLLLFKINKAADKKLIPEDVKLFVIPFTCNPIISIISFTKYLYTVIKFKPDLILSFMWRCNILSLIIGLLTHTPVIVSERTYTIDSIKDEGIVFIWKNLIKILYRFAYKITAVSEGVKSGLIKHFSIPENKIIVINNAVDMEYISKQHQTEKPDIDNYIISCGRLSKEKDFELLIKGMADIKDKKLVILGEGNLHNELKKYAKEINVDLVLPGYVSNPYAYFKNADVFVLTSHYEGFPNVILEAMACDIPVVAIKCKGGITEIIQDGYNGILVENRDPAELNKAIQRLLEDSDLREKIINNAKMALEKYSVENMVQAYEGLLKD